MVLVDTSVWVDYFRGKETLETFYLANAIGENVDICISGIILAEILQGISSEKEYHSVKFLLDRTLIFLPMLKESYELAAQIYRQAKQHGRAIRNTIDCLIASCAICHHAQLLQSDKDYLVISQFSKLKLV